MVQILSLVWLTLHETKIFLRVKMRNQFILINQANAVFNHM